MTPTRESLRPSCETLHATRNAPHAMTSALAFALAFALALACALVLCAALAIASAQPAYALSGTVPDEQESYAVTVVQPENGVIETDASTGQVVRFSGDTRYDTDAAANAEVAKINNAYGGVIVCSGENDKFADALCASGLSGMLNYPIVLVNGTAASLDAQTRETIDTLLGGIQGQIVIVGGESSVDDKISRALREYDADAYIQRYAGTDRYDTACEAYRFEMTSGLWDRSQLVIAKGNDFPDALSAAAYCTAYGVPVLLTDADEADTEGYILSAARNSASALIVGGESSVSADKMFAIEGYTPCERVSGDDRYATSLALAKWECTHGMNATTIGVASGEVFPDALGSSGLLSIYNAPLVLVSDGTVDALCDYAAESGTSLAMIFGGTQSVSQLVRYDLALCVNSNTQGRAYEGSTVYVSTGADAGYQLASISVTTAAGAVETTGTLNGCTFVMPAADVTVTATFEVAALPSVVVQQSSGGTISVNATSAEAGTTIVVTALPDEGYTLDSLTVQTTSGANMYVARTETGGTFTMPNMSVVVSATWKAA